MYSINDILWGFVCCIVLMLIPIGMITAIAILIRMVYLRLVEIYEYLCDYDVIEKIKSKKDGRKNGHE